MTQAEYISSLDDFLGDLEGDAPSGRNLRLDVKPQSTYFRFREARSGARAKERAADNDPMATETGQRHWTIARELALAALLRDTKDIEIAAWLTESLVRLD